MTHLAEIEILPFTSELAPYFKSINMEWIEQMFNLEAADAKILDNPEDCLIKKGGTVIFAKHSSLGIVGTCALLKRADGVYELTKMGVLEKARGQKVGEALLIEVLKLANEMQIDNLYLLTSKKCDAAIHLYEKFGFRHDAEIMATYGALYTRTEVAMRYKAQVH